MSDENERSVASAGSVASSPAAWAVLTADGKGVLHASCTKQGSFGWKRAMERHGEVVPLYLHPQPTLTDAEREAVNDAIYLCGAEAGLAGEQANATAWATSAATLRGLLERMK